MYRVIIVEDEMFVRLGMKSIIPWEKYDMEVTADFPHGGLALEYYKKERPDLIITDIKMPVMDGLTLIRRIREISEETQIILLTCVEEFEMAQEAIRLGALGYISKLSMEDDEFESLIGKAKQVLDNMQDKQTYTAASENDKKAVQREFLRRVTCRGNYDEEQIQNYIRNLDIDLSEDNLALCLLHVDRVNSKMEDGRWEQNSIQDAVLGLLKETLDRVCHGEVTSLADDDFLLLLNFPGAGGAGECRKKIEELASDICTAVKRYFNISGFIGISSVGGGFLTLPDKRKEASCALEKRFVTEPEKVFAWSTGKNGSGRIQDELIRLTEDGEGWNLLSAMEQDSYHMRIMDIQPEGPLLRRDILNLIYEISKAVIRNSGMNAGQKQELTLAVYQQLERCLNMYDAVSCYNRTVLTVKTNSGYHKGIRPEIMTARAHMEKHYNQDLTLGEMADSVGLSQSYFSTLFKKELGKNFAEYLYSLRIEKAKDFLLHTDKAVYEISEETGFKDHAYFSRLFKSKVGESPGEYRKKRTISGGKE